MKLRALFAFSANLIAGPAMAATLLNYDFNTGAGATAVNSGSLGAAADGSIGGSIVYSADTPFGGGYALSLDGTSSFIQVPDAWDYAGQLTVEAWIKPATTSGQQILWDDYGNPGVVFAVNGSAVQYSLSTTVVPGLGETLLAGSVSSGVWQHVAGVYNGSAMSIYVNGTLVGTQSLTGAVLDKGGLSGAVGRDNVSAALFFSGLIDDFRIHDTALAPEQLGYYADVPEAGTAAAVVILGGGLTLLAARRIRSRLPRS